MLFKEFKELLEQVSDQGAVVAYNPYCHDDYESSQGVEGIGTITVFPGDMPSGVFFLVLNGPAEHDITAGELADLIGQMPECWEHPVKGFDFWGRESFGIGSGLVYGVNEASWNGAETPYVLLSEFGFCEDDISSIHRLIS